MRGFKEPFRKRLFCKVSFSISCFPSFWAQSYTNTLMNNSRASYSTVFISFTKSSLNLKGKEPVHFCLSFFLYLTSRLHLFVFKSASHEHSLLALGSTGHFPWGGSWLNSLFILHGKTYELAGPFIHTQPQPRSSRWQEGSCSPGLRCTVLRGAALCNCCSVIQEGFHSKTTKTLIINVLRFTEVPRVFALLLWLNYPSFFPPGKKQHMFTEGE